MKRLLGVLAASLTLAGPALAVLPSEQLADPKLEARASRLGSELRCLVCQNETIEESDAPLAGTLRVLLRERLAAGDSDRQAVGFIVARYGHFVLLRPPFEAATWILWLGPAAALGVGGVWLAGLARRGAAAPAEAEALSEAERAALARRLERDLA